MYLGINYFNIHHLRLANCKIFIPFVGIYLNFQKTFKSQLFIVLFKLFANKLILKKYFLTNILIYYKNINNKLKYKLNTQRHLLVKHSPLWPIADERLIMIRVTCSSKHLYVFINSSLKCT